MSVTPETIVSDVELAALMKVSARRIRQLAEAGTLERVGVNKYQLGPSFQALLEEASGSGSALVRERTRKLSAEATRAELQLAKERGEVARIDEFERVQTARAVVIKTNVMRVPQRAVLQLLGETSETRFKAVLREEIILALKSAAEAKLDLSDDEVNDDAES